MLYPSEPTAVSTDNVKNCRRAESAELAKAQLSSHDPISEIRPQDFNVLLVDDDPAIRLLYVDVLREEGFEVESAGNASEAIKALSKSPFHLIVTDIRMPGQSGVELAEKVSREFPGTLVVFMTGYAEYTSLSEAIKLRPFGYLEKPFSHSQMTDLVSRALAYVNEFRRRESRASMLESEVIIKSRDLEFQSERVVAEKELLQGIIANANFGLIATDIQNNVHLINAFATQLLAVPGGSGGVVPGSPLEEVIPESCRTNFATLGNELRQSASIAKLDLTNPRNELRLSIIAYPIRHHERTTAFVYLLHDITETEVLQRRLLQTAKLASIGELAAGVAHEINNPLGFVTSNCNTLSSYFEKLSEYAKRLETFCLNGTDPATEINALKKSSDIEYILSDAPTLLTETLDGLQRVSKIVKDLKMFARADSDQPQTCSVNGLLDDALNLVRNEIKYKLDVVRDYGPSVELSCYHTQLVQVFTNMFVNAVHAVKEKGTLTITTSSSTKSVRISIRDNGVGIPPKYLTRIFDPFFTTKPPGKGTGMGLSISYGIVEKHGGTISVASEEGKGTEFIIELPLIGVMSSKS